MIALVVLMASYPRVVYAASALSGRFVSVLIISRGVCFKSAWVDAYKSLYITANPGLFLT
jgi:hypothetical protein